MKKRKSLIAIIAVLLITVVGVTFAYFQSTATFENLFTTGTYKVVTTEVFESPTNWAPGQEIPKTITSTNEGTIPAAVRVSYTEQWLDEDNHDITSQVASGTAIINLDNTSDWTKEGNYYYYNYILNPNETTSSFIKSVTLNPELGDDIACTTSQDGLTKTCEAANPALGGTYKLTITKETVQADKYQDIWNTNVSITEKSSAITYLSRQVEGQITPGDVIGIGETEDFYVLSTNAEKTLLLAKYNLLVGDPYRNGVVTRHLDESIPGYGLQSVDATGYFHDEDETIGGVKFCDTNYWMDGDTILSPYNPDDSLYYNNGNILNKSDDSVAHPYVYDENSTIYPYISGPNGYVNRLIEMGAPSTITGRLLSYEEAEYMIEMNIIDVSAENDMDQRFWLGSSSGYYSWIDEITNNCIKYNYIDSWTGEFGYGGIRTVIEIPTSELQ